MHIYLHFGVGDIHAQEDEYTPLGEEIRIFTDAKRFDQDILNAVKDFRESHPVPEGHYLRLVQKRYEMTPKEQEELVRRAIATSVYQSLSALETFD